MSTQTVAIHARPHGVSEQALGRLFLAPSIILMGAIALFPVLYAIVLSFMEYDGRVLVGFGGLSNYIQALTEERFWSAVATTFIFTISSVSFEFIIGMAFALVMNAAFFGRGAARVSILLPWVVPTVVVAQMWSILFNVRPGFINSWFGLGDFSWLGQPGWAMFTIIFADVWKTAPYVALLLLAGLQTIDTELYEAASIDGANALRRFTAITLPLLRPAILVALLFRTVDALRVFDLPQVMTFGQFGTESLSMLIREYVVRNVDLGYGSALSTLTFVIVLGVGMLFVLGLGRDSVIERGRTSDGELDEGATWEAAMSASHHRLDNMIALVDVNNQQADGSSNLIMRFEPLADKWEAFGFGA